MTSAFVFVYVTTANTVEAEKIGRHIIEKKLAACANIFPTMKSIYPWKGKIAATHEAVLILKTKGTLAARVQKEVEKIHSYNTPCITCLPARPNASYAKWLSRELD